MIFVLIIVINNGYSDHSNIKQGGNGLIDQFEKALMSKHVDVSCSADKTIHILCRINIKMNIDAVHYLLP